MYLYSIFDKVAEEFGPLFEAKNDGVALRNYFQLVKNSAIDGDEFVLYKLGEVVRNGSDFSIRVFEKEVVNEASE
jgi:hypothetical protein